MVRHVILWTLRPEFQLEEKNRIKSDIKRELESLKGQIPGLLEITVSIDNRLDSSNCDLMLDCLLESQGTLKEYAVHPLHVHVANTYVRPYTSQRTCLDFEI